MNSARVYIKDKDWKQAEKFLLEALEHPNDQWEAAFHLGDKVYVRSQDWEKVKKYLDLAEGAPEKLKIAIKNSAEGKILFLSLLYYASK